MRLNDRSAIVTGASMGIGAATALKLARSGVKVLAVARNKDRLDRLSAQHHLISTHVADLTSEADRAELIEAAGPVDILVNNAGLAVKGMIEDTTLSAIEHQFDLNVIALIDLSRRVLPSMLEARRGHICNVGSSISHAAIPNLVVYASTKFAVEGFTDGLRREVLDRGVGVSLIQPGPVTTGFWDRSERGDRPDVAEHSGSGVPAEWVADAIAKAIRFDRLPGYRQVGVPRAMGVARIFDIPGMALIADGIGIAMRRSGRGL